MNDTRRAVLDALADGPMSGPELARTLDVSRNAVWKHVEALRESGFEIESTGDGYRLGEIPEFGPAVEYGLDAPFEIEYHDSVGSTNDRAREIAGEGAKRAEEDIEDVVVLADEQVGGRGRLDREWVGPSGGVWSSLVLRPDIPPSHAPLLTLAAAVAVTRTAREAGVPAEIKWPNDVLVNGEKLCGILTEMEGEANRVSWVIVGIGINVNIAGDDLPEGATSVQEQAETVNRRIFVQRLLEEFDELRTAPDKILPAWREYSATLGRRVRVETRNEDVVGDAIDIESPGVLVVDTEDDEVRVHAGDCEHLRPV
ncbi:biotin--[acetyl-CoA-carboxylase] ligase [Haladaptatus pallidirubidus]|uniref:Biotin--[acetyl-CoA-carboxylase] ligase n=1 Tax=Haladaptatus pallidirubidus TaxID=1008152 RepID=A0AAV3UCA9_9EURY|nr:biotin--[acetyl-CoA-carboxylase] ligase [Haladaptatus pallidirubidus]